MHHTHLLSLLLIPTLSFAISLDCKLIVRDNIKWDLSSLAGPRSVHHLEHRDGLPTGYKNTTYTLDICAPLKKPSSDSPDSEQEAACPNGSRVCAVTRFHDPKQDGFDYQKPDAEKLPRVESVFPVAGHFGLAHGRDLDPTFVRLAKSDSAEDRRMEGVRVKLAGGRTKVEGLGEVDQRAVVDFVCDREKSGREGPEWMGGGERRVRRKRAESEDDKKEEGDGDKDGDGEGDGDGEDEGEPLPEPDKGAALQFMSYNIDTTGKTPEGVLILRWSTKHACEDAIDNPDKSDDDNKGSKSKSSGWGFFTWFIIVLFLATSTYLIFGAWLNYNRYGARGWDLLPHGDTIRDVPYLLKDWARRVMGGGGGGLGSSRGGYSTVHDAFDQDETDPFVAAPDEQRRGGRGGYRDEV